MENITGKYTIKQIFKDHWSEYLKKHIEVPEYIREEVRKVMNCRDSKNNGYLKFVCPNHQNQYSIIPFSCKSRFCNVCGVSETTKWIYNTVGDFPKTKYWHIVFTIPDYLWYFFLQHEKKDLLELLFKASSQTVISWFKTRKIIPAITCVLHTYGGKLNYNTHIHMIVSGLSFNKEQWRKIDYLPENMLKKRWRAILLTMLSAYISSSLKKFLFKINWYVHLGIKLINPEITCNYIGRYTKRPIIAETRIIDYNGFFITFFYDDKKALNPLKKKRFIKLGWEEFISRLIQHIPKPRFRMIRHYGILANSVKNKYQKIVFKLLNQNKEISTWLRWRLRQIKFKKIDPLVCKICGREMVLKELAFWSNLTNQLEIIRF